MPWQEVGKHQRTQGCGFILFNASYWISSEGWMCSRCRDLFRMRVLLWIIDGSAVETESIIITDSREARGHVQCPVSKPSDSGVIS